MLTLLVLSSAFAQDFTNGEMPELDAQLYRTPMDAQQTLWANDATLLPSGTGIAKVTLGYVEDPLHYEFQLDEDQNTDDEDLRLIQDAIHLNVIGAMTFGPARIGVDIPFYTSADSETLVDDAGIGDIALDGKLAWPGGRDQLLGFGVALGGRVMFPTDDMRIALGAEEVRGEIELIGDYVYGPLLVAANVGHRANPEVRLENITLDDQLYGRLGAGFAFLGPDRLVADMGVLDEAGLSVDFYGHTNYDETDNEAGNPVEGLVGAWVRLAEVVAIRGGVGGGFTQGIGSPDVRGLLTVGYEPMFERELEPIVEAPPPDVDYGTVRVRVLDPSDMPVTNATWSFEGHPTELIEGGVEEAQVLPGLYHFTIQAPQYQPVTIEANVRAHSMTELIVRLSEIEEQPVAVRIDEMVYFDFDRSNLRPESVALLNDIGDLLEARPDVELTRLEGRADERGTNAYNIDLAMRRAMSVYDYLVAQGVSGARLQPVSYGEEDPLVLGSNEWAWQQNRSVRFVVLEQDMNAPTARADIEPRLQRFLVRPASLERPMVVPTGRETDQPEIIIHPTEESVPLEMEFEDERGY